MQERAKNLDGLMRVMHEATAAMKAATFLISLYKNDEARITHKRISDAQEAQALAIRDIEAGLVDLGGYSFDSVAHDVVFSSSGLHLEEDLIVLEEPAEASSIDDLFDFSKVPGDFR